MGRAPPKTDPFRSQLQGHTSLERVDGKIVRSSIGKIAANNPALLPKLKFEGTEKIDGSLATFAIGSDGSVRIASKNVEITGKEKSNIYKGLEAAGVVNLFSRLANDLRAHVANQDANLAEKHFFLDGEIITDSEKSLRGSEYGEAPRLYIFDMFVKVGEDPAGPVDRIPLEQRQKIVQWLQTQASEEERVSYVPVLNDSFQPFDTKDMRTLVEEWQNLEGAYGKEPQHSREAISKKIEERVQEILLNLASRNTELGTKKGIAEGVVLKLLGRPSCSEGLKLHLECLSLLKVFHPNHKAEYNKLNAQLAQERSKSASADGARIAELGSAINNHPVHETQKKG
ncbi:MAG: RNA ligase family protein [Alphaproteobacteria bacterium]